MKEIVMISKLVWFKKKPKKNSKTMKPCNFFESTPACQRMKFYDQLRWKNVSFSFENYAISSRVGNRGQYFMTNFQEEYKW